MAAIRGHLTITMEQLYKFPNLKKRHQSLHKFRPKNALLKTRSPQVAEVVV